MILHHVYIFAKWNLSKILFGRVRYQSSLDFMLPSLTIGTLSRLEKIHA